MKMKNQLSDILTIYHQGLNVFPYWTDELIELWDKKIVSLLKDVQTGLDKVEFYKKLKEISSLLNDGHALVFLPNDIKQKLTYSPIEFKIIGKKLVINRATDEFSKYLFQPIEKINQLSVETFLEVMRNYYWKHNINQSLKMFQNEYSYIFECNSFFIEFENNQKTTIPFLPDQISFSTNYAKKIEDDCKVLVEHEAIGIYQTNKKTIVKLNHFMSEEIVSLFYKYIPCYLDSEELIFDIRNNGGGNSGLANQITQAFFDREFETEKISTQVIVGEYIASAYFLNIDGYDSKKETDPELIKMNQIYRHQYLTSRIETANYKKYQGLLKNLPVKIIQNDLTYSAAENFVINFANTKRATLIGTTTAGSTGQPALFNLETGGIFVITAKKVEVPNGIKHHNIGIEPDIKITESLENEKREFDVVLNYVLEN